MEREQGTSGYTRGELVGRDGGRLGCEVEPRADELVSCGNGRGIHAPKSIEGGRLSLEAVLY